MITPSFSLTATERVLPKLALDFTTASLDSRVTFTRTGNTATVTNSSGDIASINANLPRFDFDPTTLVCKGLLIEEARTNSIRNNTMVGTVAGTPGTLPTNWGSGTGVAGLTREVIGTGTEKGIAYVDVKISGTAASGGSYGFGFETSTGVAAVQNQTWANSLYLKIAGGSAANINLFRAFFQENNSGGGYLTEANITITTPTTASLITQRYSAIRTIASATAAYLNSGFNFTFSSGAVIDITIRIGLPQLELGAFPTSVIITGSGAVTRNADVATMTGTNFSDWYNASEGAFVVNAQTARQVAIGATGIVGINNGSVAEQINCFFRGSGATGANIFSSSIGQMDQSPTGVITANTPFKLGIAYKLNDAVSYAQGTVQTTDTLVTVPSVNQMQIGLMQAGQYLNGWIQKFNYWPQRILNAEGQAFSK
jgi:hypothetical protein